jgi:hypothetical protein
LPRLLFGAADANLPFRNETYPKLNYGLSLLLNHDLCFIFLFILTYQVSEHFVSFADQAIENFKLVQLIKYCRVLFKRLKVIWGDWQFC